MPVGSDRICYEVTKKCHTIDVYKIIYGMTFFISAYSYTSAYFVSLNI